MLEATFFGRARYLAMSADQELSFRRARVWVLAPTAGGFIVSFPDARDCRRGFPIAYLINPTAHAITLHDASGGSLGSLNANQAAQVGLADNSTEAGAWAVKITSITTTSPSLLLRKGYVVGGTGSTTSRLDYDQAANTWAAGTACPGGHVEGAFMPIGGHVFLVGSYPQTGGVSEKCHELDDTGAWATRTDCPYQPARTCGAAVQGAGFIFSGDGQPEVARYTRDAWTARATIPYTKTRATAAGIGDKAYIVSGEPVPIPNLAYWPIHDVYWSIAYQPSAARHSISSFAIQDRLYAMGGYLDSPVTRYDACDAYDPATDTWATKAALGAGVRYGGAAWGGNARGYYAGGRDGTDAATATAHAYAPNAWVALAAMPAARSEIANQGAPA